MITGLIIRNFKTYSGINYVPITDQDQFSGLVGPNGIGKSSILEALDTFFNSRNWNLNTAANKQGTTKSKPLIIPIFLLDKCQIPVSFHPAAQMLNNVALNVQEQNINAAQRVIFNEFKIHRTNIARHNNLNNKFLIPLGIDYEGLLNLSMFNCDMLVSEYNNLHASSPAAGSNKLDDDELEYFNTLLYELKNTISYIYIPREIDPDSFTKLENKEIQILMGESLNQIIGVAVKDQQISEINRGLNEFISKISEELEVYSYRTPHKKQQNLKKTDVYALIAQAFFGIRKLHKQSQKDWIEIDKLSSGEKQRAIIDIAYNMITKHRGDSSKSLIVGIDEPESSLHMSACFEHFQMLYKLSRSCMQVVFATHWYGFLPTIENGSSTIISFDSVIGEHKFDQINLAFYREQIKQSVSTSRGAIPYDIRLKSLNDFIQSLVTSCISNPPFNWLICEGSSERVYLNHYLSDLVEQKNLRIVPVGGASEIKKIYLQIEGVYEDLKDAFIGKIFLLSDTDSQLVSYETKKYKNLNSVRMVRSETNNEIHLVQINSNPKTPATEIEHALNGPIFYKTLNEFVPSYQNELGFLHSYQSDIEKMNKQGSSFDLDLRQSELRNIQTFFDLDNNKYKFAVSYCNNATAESCVPSWVNEIRKWF